MTRLDRPIDGMAKNVDVEQSVRIGRAVFDPTNEKLYHVVGEGEDEFAVEDDISSPDSSSSSTLDEDDDDTPLPPPSALQPPHDEASHGTDPSSFNHAESATTSEAPDFQLLAVEEDATTSDVLELLGDDEDEEEL